MAASGKVLLDGDKYLIEFTLEPGWTILRRQIFDTKKEAEAELRRTVDFINNESSPIVVSVYPKP